VSDIKQQTADGARPLARVGDVIAHGRPIPGNVRRMLDVETDHWIRVPEGWHLEGSSNLPKALPHRDYWPMTVVGVDLEAQPVERHCYDSAEHPPHTWVYAPGMTSRAVFACTGKRPASGPVVLALPQVPDGAVALIGGRTGRRYELRNGWWRNDDVAWGGNLAAVLHDEGSVTVEFAPPREPRVWPKLEATISDLPDVVEVDRAGTWRRRAGSTLFQQGETWRTLAQLRELGEVREVLT
jgi:hypothetical protein